MRVAPELQLKLPARPENVAVVRHALAGIADTLPVEASMLSDMKTAVTEACNNVVVHAYPDSAGTLEVEARPVAESVTITVRDHGAGMQPAPVEPAKPTLSLGLPLIAALSERYEIRGGSGLGMEVSMTFGSQAGGTNQPAAAITTEAPTPKASPGTGVSITPGPMVAPVLGRITAMLAARADFSLDRLADAVLVSDAISAQAPSCISGSHVSVAIEDGDGSLDFRVGPLASGGANELLTTMNVPGFEHSLERLANEVQVEQADSSEDGQEYLRLTLGPSPSPSS